MACYSNNTCDSYWGVKVAIDKLRVPFLGVKEAIMAINL